MARSLTELLAENPAWPAIAMQASTARNQLEILPARTPEREVALCDLQASTDSVMGAIVYETGGILVDHGWVRVLGSGHPKLPRSLPAYNRVAAPDSPLGDPWLVVADDVLGGSFALDAGNLSGQAGLVHYFAPDSLQWECLNMGYPDLIQWMCQGDIAQFYAEQRWRGWQDDVRLIAGDQAFAFKPRLWDDGPITARRQRVAVLMSELFALQMQVRQRLEAEHGEHGQ